MSTREGAWADRLCLLLWSPSLVRAAYSSRIRPSGDRTSLGSAPTLCSGQSTSWSTRSVSPPISTLLEGWSRRFLASSPVAFGLAAPRPRLSLALTDSSPLRPPCLRLHPTQGADGGLYFLVTSAVFAKGMSNGETIADASETARREPPGKNWQKLGDGGGTDREKATAGAV